MTFVQETFARKRAYGGSAALGAQARLGGLFPGCRCGWAALLGQQGWSGDRRAAARQLEFESMLDDAAFIALEGVEQPVRFAFALCSPACLRPPEP